VFIDAGLMLLSKKVNNSVLKCIFLLYTHYVLYDAYKWLLAIYDVFVR